jgi:hypothetical protein
VRRVLPEDSSYRRAVRALAAEIADMPSAADVATELKSVVDHDRAAR